MVSQKDKDIFSNIFFDGLSEDNFKSIETTDIIKLKFLKDELIIEENCTGDVIYLIAAGDVIITKKVANNEIELSRKCAGEYFGEMALFEESHLRSANVKALSDVTLYEINKETFFKLFNNYDEIRLNIIKTINSSIRESGNRLGETTVIHDRELSIKDYELVKTKSLLREVTELKRYIDEQKSELELINRELEKKNRELYQHSIRDDLTCVNSKNHFNLMLKNEFSRSCKYGMDLALIIVKVDINKSSAGMNLKTVAEILTKLCEYEDVIGRVSDDSFGIIMPHRNYEKAFELSGILEENVKDKTELKICTGVIGSKCSKIKTAEDLLSAAFDKILC